MAGLTGAPVAAAAAGTDTGMVGRELPVAASRPVVGTGVRPEALVVAFEEPVVFADTADTDCSLAAGSELVIHKSKILIFF